MSQNGNALRFASEELRNDRDVVKAAVSNKDQSLLYASEDLKSDKEIVMIAMNKNVSSLYYASEKLQNDKDLLVLLREHYKNNKRDCPDIDWFRERMNILMCYEEQELLSTKMIKGKKIFRVKKF